MVADTLSRSLETTPLYLLGIVKSCSSVTPSNFPVDWSEIATAQSSDPEIQD